MPVIILNFHGQEALADLKDPGKVIYLRDSFTIVGFSHGMASGAPSLVIRIDLPDGRTVIQETSVNLFMAAAAGIKGWMERQ